MRQVLLFSRWLNTMSHWICSPGAAFRYRCSLASVQRARHCFVHATRLSPRRPADSCAALARQAVPSLDHVDSSNWPRRSTGGCRGVA
jgi:hypothetical protein